MGKLIQIRNVPDRVHATLKARAALPGQPLTDYLLAEIRKGAEHSTAGFLGSQRMPSRTGLWHPTTTAPVWPFYPTFSGRRVGLSHAIMPCFGNACAGEKSVMNSHHPPTDRAWRSTDSTSRCIAGSAPRMSESST